MNTSEYKVSIVTPAFNDESFIAETIKSVLAQTHQNFEMIIVDDCSTDKTADIIRAFSDTRIIYVKNECNSGAAFSRNRAISMAKGDFIAFLDGDDLWLPNKLENQLSFMLSNGYDFSATAYEITDQGSPNKNKVVLAPETMTHKTFKKVCYIGCLTVMYKRSVFPNLSIPDDIRKRNDYAMWLKLSQTTPCHFLNEVLAIYRKRSGSLSSSKKSKLFMHHVFLFKKIFAYSTFRAFLCAFRNVVFYFWKNHRYIRDIKHEQSH